MCRCLAHLVERVAREHGVEHPLGMTLGVSDGERVYAIRYASDGHPRTLFHSKDMRALKELNPRLDGLSDDTRVVVSEPFGTLSESWVEIRPSSSVVIDGGGLEMRDFRP